MDKGIDRKKLRYSILMELNNDNKISHTTYGLSIFDFSDFIKDMQTENLIRKAIFTKDGVAMDFARITMTGEDYLSDNSKMAKAYSAVKELRDWIPFY